MITLFDPTYQHHFPCNMDLELLSPIN